VGGGKGMKRIRRYLGSLLCGLVLAALPVSAPLAAGLDTEEYKIKAALVYNFARFTEWPEASFEETEGAIRIVYYGDESLREAFASVAGRTIGDRPIEVTHAARPADVGDCHLLFLARTEREDWQQVLAAVDGNPVLTVGEMNGFLESGGVVNLHTRRSKLRFQVNLDRAREQDLRLSSQLLVLASKVIDSSR